MNADANAKCIDQALTTWMAGAEVELMGSLGIPPEDHIGYMGMGLPVKVVEASGQGRYREVADELGLVGQRLDWAVKGVRIVVAAMRAPPDSEEQWKKRDACNRISHRAAALLGEARRARPRDDEREYYEVVIKLMTTLDRIRLWRHGRAPLLTRMLAGVSSAQLDDMIGLAQLGADAIEKLATWRRRAAIRARRKFAAAADLRTAHRVTRAPNFVGRKTASANKGHLGEASNQDAADRGLTEWAPAWHGDGQDHGEELEDGGQPLRPREGRRGR